MAITMTSKLPDHCITASAGYDSIKHIKTKHECKKLNLNLICHTNRKGPFAIRFSAGQRADQRKVIKLLKKHVKTLTKPDRTLILRSITSGLYEGYLSTPDRITPARPAPGFHVSISCHPEDRLAYLDITFSLDNGLFHDLVASEIVHAYGCEPMDDEYSEIENCSVCDPFDSAFDRANTIMKTYGINLVRA